MKTIYLVEKREDIYREGENNPEIYHYTLGIYERLSDALKKVRQDVENYENVEVFDKHNYCFHDNGKGLFTEWTVVDRDLE